MYYLASYRDSFIKDSSTSVTFPIGDINLSDVKPGIVYFTIVFNAEVQNPVSAKDCNVSKRIIVKLITCSNGRHDEGIYRDVRQSEYAVCIGYTLRLDLGGNYLTFVRTFAVLVHFNGGTTKRLAAAIENTQLQAAWYAVQILAVVPMSLVEPVVHCPSGVFREKGAAVPHKAVGAGEAQSGNEVPVRAEVQLVDVNKSKLVAHFVEQTVINIFFCAVPGRTSWVTVRRMIAEREDGE